jgi:hypothetical protein
MPKRKRTDNLKHGCHRQFLFLVGLFLKIFFPEIEVQLEAQWAEPVSLTFHSALRKLNTDPSIGASHQVSVHLAKQFQGRRFLEINQPTRNKNFLWQPEASMEGPL